MTDRYNCILRVKTKPNYFKEFLEKALEYLPFEAHSVDCFYNEFENHLNRTIPYDKDFLLNNLSTQEMKGISAMSIYDKEYQAEHTTPFVRLNFNPVNNEESSINIEWIYFTNLDFLIVDDRVLSLYLGENFCLSFCNFQNQYDCYEQSNSKESWLKKNWGKRIIHKGIHFQAAPLMYFGKCYEPCISSKMLLKFGIQLENGVVKVELGDLYSTPYSYRKQQKKFWQTMRLHDALEVYRATTKVDFEELLKRKAELKKEK